MPNLQRTLYSVKFGQFPSLPLLHNLKSYLKNGNYQLSDIKKYSKFYLRQRFNGPLFSLKEGPLEIPLTVPLRRKECSLIK